MDLPDGKLYLGPRLRVLRRELDINQTQMAEELGVSPSYLNHLERNQRPLTTQMLRRLAETYDVDVRAFVTGDGDDAATALAEALADPLVRDIGVPGHELRAMVESHPRIAKAIGRFVQALTDLRRVPEMLERIGGAPGGSAAPLAWLGELLTRRHNHFAEIEDAADALVPGLRDDPADRYTDLRDSLAGAGISVRVMPDEVLNGALRHFDVHRRRLMLAERLPAASRLFALAYQLVLTGLRDRLAEVAEQAEPPEAESRALMTIALANYAAACLLMPYGRFLASAESLNYALARLAARFGVSLEQAAHRLTTLNRAGARGLPLFLLKIDEAGNVLKRIAPEPWPIVLAGGGCPRWRVGRAFRAPGETLAQVVEVPDGSRYATLTHVLPRGGRGGLGLTALILGGELKHAARLLPAGMPANAEATTIGPGCRLCERVGCPDRALPPLTRPLDLDPLRRTAAPLPFRQL